MSGSLAIYVRSGLCNRLRVVLSAIAFCEQTNRNLKIYWPKVDPSEKGGGGIFEAGLSDLYDHPFEEINEQQWGECGRLAKQNDITLETPGDLHIRTINMFPGHEPPDGYPGKNCGSHSFLSHREHYGNSFLPYLDKLKPAKEVQRWIDEGNRSLDAAGGRGVMVIALIIRYSLRNPENVDVSTSEKLTAALMAQKVGTDCNFETDKRSDVTKYIARMKQFPPETIFFLATDCRYIEDIIRNGIGTNRVVNLPQTYKYNKETIQKRLAELYIAAKCERILGAYISSWSEYSGWIAGGMYSACYQWPAMQRERYEDMGLWEEVQ